MYRLTTDANDEMRKTSVLNNKTVQKIRATR